MHTHTHTHTHIHTHTHTHAHTGTPPTPCAAKRLMLRAPCAQLLFRGNCRGTTRHRRQTGTKQTGVWWPQGGRLGREWPPQLQTPWFHTVHHCVLRVRLCRVSAIILQCFFHPPPPPPSAVHNTHPTLAFSSMFQVHTSCCSSLVSAPNQLKLGTVGEGAAIGMSHTVATVTPTCSREVLLLAFLDSVPLEGVQVSWAKNT